MIIKLSSIILISSVILSACVTQPNQGQAINEVQQEPVVNEVQQLIASN